jgi:hypothetical protein
MFAQQKLVCGQVISGEVPMDEHAKFAILASRIPFKFNPVSPRAVRNEQIQVEKHLRICINMREGFAGVETVAASEPLLAEAAREFMITTEMNSPIELQNALAKAGTDRGDRGEVMAMLLLTQSYDIARVHFEERNSHPFHPVVPLSDFLEALFPMEAKDRVGNTFPNHATPGMEHVTLNEAFSDAKVYFAHFKRAQDFEVVNLEYLSGCMERGAAILCAVGQPGIHIFIPVSMRNGSLQTQDMGVILIHVRNKRSDRRSPDRAFFDVMDPFAFDVFDRSDYTVPIIRMVLDLGADCGFVRLVPPFSREQSDRPAMTRTSSRKPKEEAAPSTTTATRLVEPDTQVHAQYRDTEESRVTRARDDASEDKNSR